MLLTVMGHNTRTAHDGLQAVELAEAFRPDLIVLDIGLPKLNGYDACRRIRQKPWAKDTHIVAATGWGQGKRRDKTGWELRMKESYREGLASRSGPESYAGGGNIAGVATAGVRAGQPLSSEITHLACRPRPDKGKATSTLALLASRRRTRRSLRTWACAETSIARTGRSWELPWGAVRPHQRGTVGERHRR
jgi:hypothetical protein